MEDSGGIPGQGVPTCAATEKEALPPSVEPSAAIACKADDYSRLAAALRVMGASERAQAGRVQGPSFVGSQWGADIIDAHLARADILFDAAEALVQAARAQIVAISQTCGDA